MVVSLKMASSLNDLDSDTTLPVSVLWAVSIVLCLFCLQRFKRQFFLCYQVNLSIRFIRYS
jgi:beta-lactamase regulating signal transducer with metallopeptidase domain